MDDKIRLLMPLEEAEALEVELRILLNAGKIRGDEVHQVRCLLDDLGRQIETHYALYGGGSKR